MPSDSSSTLARLFFSKEAIPNLIRHAVFRRVGMATIGRYVPSRREFVPRVIGQVDVRGALLESCPLGDHRNLLQFVVVQVSELPSPLEEIECGTIASRFDV